MFHYLNQTDNRYFMRIHQQITTGGAHLRSPHAEELRRGRNLAQGLN
jgi:hypothetical protein